MTETLKMLEAGGPRRWSLLAVCGVLALAGIGPVTGELRPEELIHPHLEGENSLWLIGPIARMATDEEVEGYLAVRSADEAERFIEEFWHRRNTAPGVSGNVVRELFEKRAAEADEQFGEGTFAGRRTARGTIYILYGPPERTEYEEFRDVREPDVELWRYPKKAEEGLDGRRPKRLYRFARQGDVTTFYSRTGSRDSGARRPPGEGMGPSRLPGEP